MKNKIKTWLGCMMAMMFFGFSGYGLDAKFSDPGTAVLEAYEMRINGNAEKAEAMLSELIKNDSTDALACFELARTKQHLFLGGKEIPWADVVRLSKRAAVNDPGNEVYAFYYAYTSYFNALVSMMQQSPDVPEKITHACDAFRSVLELDPDCHEARLYLTDIYGMLPEEMGGNKEKAMDCVNEMNDRNMLFGAMASARLLPDTANQVIYWQKVGKEAGMNATVLEELGRAYLMKSDTENGTKYFVEAILADKSRRYLYMRLARYHLMGSQQDPGNKDMHLEKAMQMVNNYLISVPALIPPQVAYANGFMSLIRMLAGDDKGRNEYQELAASLDPFYSRATGMPSEMLYCRPGEVKIQYESFFNPF
jgi:tetratricopeptide (TPR) repeat protein